MPLVRVPTVCNMADAACKHGLADCKPAKKRCAAALRAALPINQASVQLDMLDLGAASSREYQLHALADIMRQVKAFYPDMLSITATVTWDEGE